MTKASSILICPVAPLRQLPPGEVDIIRRFLFDHVRGMDRESDRRWRRLWGRMWKAEPGEGFEILNGAERGGPYHRRHRVILQKLFDSQDRFRHIDRLHDWLKVGAGFVEWHPGKDGKPVALPRSTAFASCSDDEMREAHEAMVDWLHTDRAQRTIWRNVRKDQRQGMLDAVLAAREES